LEFKRYFTKEKVHPFDEVNWVKTTSQINDKDGNIIFKKEGVEFPDFWEQTSIDITVEKYFTKDEYSLREFIFRIVKWYTDKGLKDKYFSSKKDAIIFSEELTYLLLHQKVAFNTPVNLNVGVQEPPQVSACFILSAEDTMDSISENMNIEMNIFRKGSGAGSNRSNLRSSREEVSTGGTAMGPIIASQIYDKIANATKSGGKSRRAAKMEVLDIDHGDIVNFIIQKAEVERAAKTLIKNGWSSDFDDPKGVYKLLGLQNFNESVSVTDAFMRAVEKDEDWALLARNKSHFLRDGIIIQNQKETSQGEFIQSTNNDWYISVSYESTECYKVLEWVKARDLWALICKSTWECADPGLQFRDTINNWHTCKNNGEIVSSNPCSEYFFLNDTSCNLASFNLLKFLKEDSTFDVSGFIHSVRILITAMDISVHNASYPTEKIKEKTVRYRTLGLGYANLGALLLSKAIPYDSDEGRQYTSAITALLLAAAYNTSNQLATELGPFEGAENNLDSILEVLGKHYKSIQEYQKIASEEALDILKEASKIFPKNTSLIRNAQTVVIAPTGTIGLMMGCETTGPEPMLGLVTYKKMVGGGFKELTMPSVKTALQKLNYSDVEIENILTKIKLTGKLPENLIKEKHLPIFATSFGDENILSPEAHLKMLSVIQPFVSGGISKTVNLLYTATVDDIDKIYKEAWKLGLKSISIYRDGCKGSQPLNLKEESKKEIEKVIQPVRKRLPKDRPGYNHEFQIGMQKGFLQFGFYPDTGKLGEMFAEISKGGSTINGLMNTIAILVSHMLQYGIPIEEIINTFKELKFEPNGITQNPDIKFASSIPDYIGKYIELVLSGNKEIQLFDKIEVSDEVKESLKKVLKSVNTDLNDLSGPPCDICGHIMVRNGTCYYCKNCGHTSGCS